MCVNCRFFNPFVYTDSEQPHHCGFLNAPIGDRMLQVDCGDFDPSAEERREEVWISFARKE
jgi:hypothetical protein